MSSFSYSDALVAKGGSWNYDSLNKFLYKPKAYIDGTKMNYVGLKKPEDRAAMIAWLRTLGSSSYALPSEADIAAEKAELAPEPEETEEEAAVEGEQQEGEEGTEAEDGAAEAGDTETEGEEARDTEEEPVTPAAAN